MAKVATNIPLAYVGFDARHVVADFLQRGGRGGRGASPRTQVISERIRALDRSTESFDKQIAEAFAILALNPKHEDPDFRAQATEARRLHGFGPLEEWLLRWVIGKFGPRPSTRGQITSPYTYPQAWELVTATIELLPSEIAARVLKANNFIIAVQNCFGWLKDNPSPPNNPSSSKEAPPSESTGSSTSETVQSGSRSLERPAKRRRGNSSQERPTQHTTCSPCSLFECVITSIAMIEYRSQNEQDAAKQDFWFSCIACQPPAAAKLLGNSLNIVCNGYTDFGAQVKSGTSTDTSKLLDSIFLVCERSDKIAGDANPGTNTEAYLHHTLIPSLRLLQRCQNEPQPDALFTDNLLNRVKAQVKLQLIEPLRAAFRRQASATGAERHNQEVYINKLLAPLDALLANVIRGTHGTHVRQAPHPDLQLAGILFDLALELSTQETAKRYGEDAWLQILFSKLVRYLGLIPMVDNDDWPYASVVQVLNDMIRAGTPHKIFDQEILKQLVISHWNPKDDPDPGIGWELIRLCLRAKPTLILERVAQPTDADVGKKSSNTVCSTLLSWLKSLQPESQGSPSDYDYNSTSINRVRSLSDSAALPLVEAYLTLKKVDELLQLWQDQLISTNDDPALSQDALYRTIWENEDILMMVAKEVDAHLTTSQFTRWFRNLLGDFSEQMMLSVHSADSRQSRWRSDLFLLDCLLCGISGKDLVSQEKLIALEAQGSYQMAFDSLSHLLTASSTPPKLSKWRIWRILTRITQCLAKIPDGLHALRLPLPFEELCTRMAGDLNLLLNSEPWFSDSYQEIFEGFKYLANWNGTPTAPQRPYSSGDDVPPFLEGLSQQVGEWSGICAELCSRYESYDGRGDWMFWNLSPQVDHSQTLVLECVTWIVTNDLKMKSSRFLDVINVSHLRYFAMLHDDDIDIVDFELKTRFRWSYRKLWDRTLSPQALKENAEAQASTIEALIYAIDPFEDMHVDLWNHNLCFTFDALSEIPQSALRDSDRLKIVKDMISAFALLTESHDTSGYEEDVVEVASEAERTDSSVESDSDGSGVEDSDGSGVEYSDHSGLEDSDVEDQNPKTEGEEYRELAMYVNTASSALGLLIHVTDSLSGDMPLVSNPGCLLKHVPLFTNSKEDERSFVKFLRRVLACILAEATEAHNSSPFEELVKVAKRKAGPGDLSALVSNSIELWSIPVLSFIEEHAQKLGESYPALSSKLDAAISICSKRLMTLSQPHDYWYLRELPLLLELLIPLPTMILARLETKEVQATLVEYCTPMLEKDEKDETFILCGKFHLRLHEVNGTSPATVVTPWDTVGNERFAILPAESQVEILGTLLQESSSRARERDLRQLKLCLEHTQNINDATSTGLRWLLSTSLFNLCREVTVTSSPQCCMLSMECVEHMLREKRSVIFQEHVEAMLDIIATMAGPGAPAFTADHTRQLFTGSCQLLLTLLRSHRPKLGARYHMVAQCVQSLLRCLYTPYAKQGKTAPLPAWLNRRQSPAAPEEAELVAQILTMLCNPSPSAVARSRRNELNDATKVARDIAGQHLGPVVEELCASELAGSIPSAARAALMPGVWAVISAMDIEHMRAMNEGFAGKDVREVWKRVFAEWEKAEK